MTTLKLWLYYLLRTYFRFFLTLFYRQTYTINSSNIPKKGAAIVYGNHRNYVIDGLNIMMETQRPVRLVVAASTVRQPGIGHFIRGLNVIAVERMQDVQEEKGRGRILEIQKGVVKGQNTRFGAINAGSILKLGNGSLLTVKNILSENTLEIEEQASDLKQAQFYTVKPKINYQRFFSQAITALKQQQCVTIFPEGISHDRMKMKPFKAGIATMALMAQEMYGTEVKFVPCGFYLYKQHMFRSKIILRFGEAVSIPEGIVELRKGNKKEAVSQLLAFLRQKNEEIVMNFDSQEELPALILARQLYTLRKNTMTVEEKVGLDRLFAKGFMAARSQPKYRDTYERLLQFSAFLQKEGISVRNFSFSTYGIQFMLKMLTLIVKIILSAVLMLPGLILWGLPAYLISLHVQKQRLYWKKVSRPLDSNNYFVAGYKIFYACVVFPIITVTISVLAYYWISKVWDFSVQVAVLAGIALLILQPMYAHLFVRLYDSFVDNWAQMKFISLKLFNHETYLYFLTTQASLEGAVKQIVEELKSNIESEAYPEVEHRKIYEV